MAQTIGGRGSEQVGDGSNDWRSRVEDSDQLIVAAAALVILLVICCCCWRGCKRKRAVQSVAKGGGKNTANPEEKDGMMANMEEGSTGTGGIEVEMTGMAPRQHIGDMEETAPMKL